MGRRPARFPTWGGIIPEGAPESVIAGAARRRDSARRARRRVRAPRPSLTRVRCRRRAACRGCRRPSRRQRSSVAARECESAIPPVAIASPAAVASIHSGAEPSELPCRLMSTTSLASAPAAAATPGRAPRRRPDLRLAKWHAHPPILAARSSVLPDRPRRSGTPRRPTETESPCRGRPAATWQASRHPRARCARARSNASSAAPCARSSLSAGSTSTSTASTAQRVEFRQDELPHAGAARVPAVARIEQQRM